MSQTAAHGEEPAPTDERTEAGECPELVGHFYAWWRGDPLPPLAPVPGLTTAPGEDERLVARLSGIGEGAVRERVRRGHRPWLARIAGEPAGWGWVAAGEAGIPELGVAFTLSPGDRYLWDFVTLPSWRGRGVYPALLRAILAQEGAERFWIGHDRGNAASARGIAKAGFREVGAAYRLPDGRLVFVPSGPTDRVVAAAMLLGRPIPDR